MKIIKKNKHLIFIILFFILIFTTIIGIGNYFFNYALVRSNNNVPGSKRNIQSGISEQAQNIISQNYSIQTEKTNTWLKSVPQKTVSIVTSDNLRLSGTEFIKDNGLYKYAIIVHGYTKDKAHIADIANHYYDNGFNVITPDLRAHGESDGKYIGMGWLDKNDLLKWISLILDDNPKAKIVLHGVSMGGAAVMMVSGEMVPENVVAIVEDCGYTSVLDIFSSEIKVRFKLPPFPIINCANLIANIRAGYRLEEASSINQVKKSMTPILFIHGTADNFTPVEMCYQLYNAATCKKEKLIIDGAGHATSRFLEPDTYYNTVFDFINKEIN